METRGRNAGRLFGLLIGALAAAASAGACPLPRDAVVTQSARLPLGGDFLTIATLSVRGPDADRSRLQVLDGRCRALWDVQVDGLESRFEVRRVGGVRLLEFVTLRPAGDETLYTHRLLIWRRGRLELALAPIEHTGKDGFYLGPLTRGRGKGVVTWTADPSGEGEAEPHPFVVRTWRWRDGAFAGPATYETTRKYAANDDAASRADAVAKAMDLPYRDQTGLERFMAPGEVMKRKDALEERLAERQ